MYKETSWDHAPDLMDGALNIALTAKTCNLNYWTKNAAQGTWQGLVNGHMPNAVTPGYMKKPGALREALLEEFGFRSVAEELATRALAYLVIEAPDIATMEFYLTQAVDEARHSSVFRGHLFEMGVTEEELPDVLEKYAGQQIVSVLKPLERWVLDVVREQRDFIGGVVIFTILVEGVLAPAAELSERKWRLIDPAAAQIERGANIDEVRHLTVGASVIRDHLAEHSEDKDRIVALMRRGYELWEELPTDDVVMQRERLFQEGMQEVRDILQGYELVPGRLLLDTTPQERLDIANAMSRELQHGRLRYMGLEDAIELVA